LIAYVLAIEQAGSKGWSATWIRLLRNWVMLQGWACKHFFDIWRFFCTRFLSPLLYSFAALNEIDTPERSE